MSLIDAHAKPPRHFLCAPHSQVGLPPLSTAVLAQPGAAAAVALVGALLRPTTTDRLGAPPPSAEGGGVGASLAGEYPSLIAHPFLEVLHLPQRGGVTLVPLFVPGDSAVTALVNERMVDHTKKRERSLYVT